MVWSLGVVFTEVFQHQVVEGAEVVGEEVFLVVDEFFLQGAVEAFVAGVHFGAFGVGVVVSPVLFAGECVEGAGELAAVIGEDFADGRGEDGLDEGGELRGVFAVGARHGDGECESGVVVGGGEDVAAQAEDEQHDGIKRHAFAGRGGAQVRSAVFGRGFVAWFGFSFGRQALRRMAHFIRRISDEAADGAGAGQWQAAFGAPGFQQHMQLVRSEVRYFFALPAYLRQQRRRPDAAARSLGRAALAVQAGRAVLSIGGAPRMQRGAANIGVVQRRGQAVFFPKRQGVSAMLCGGAHAGLLQGDGSRSIQPRHTKTDVLELHFRPPSQTDFPNAKSPECMWQYSG